MAQFEKGNVPTTTHHRGGRPPGSRRKPQLLMDLEWAYKHSGDSEPGNPQAEDFRMMWISDRKGFLAVYSKERSEYYAAKEARQKAKAASSPSKDLPETAGLVVEEDLPRERLMGLMEKEWGEYADYLRAKGRAAQELPAVDGGAVREPEA